MLKKFWYIIIVVAVLVVPLFYINSEDEEVVIEEKKEELIEREDKKVQKSNCYVDIKGEVLNPGVYEIENDKRIIDVINKAGGLTKNADVSILNLSKKIYDEMNIKIYSKKEIQDAKNIVNNMYKEKEPEVIEVIKEVEKVVEKECKCEEKICDKSDIFIETNAIKGNEKGNDTDSNINSIVEEIDNGLVNINTASKDELMLLDGIGESKAIKIIEYRENNKFSKIEDIKNVSGIGDSLFEKIKAHITI